MTSSSSKRTLLLTNFYPSTKDDPVEAIFKGNGVKKVKLTSNTKLTNPCIVSSALELIAEGVDLQTDAISNTEQAPIIQSNKEDVSDEGDIHDGVKSQSNVEETKDPDLKLSHNDNKTKGSSKKQMKTVQESWFIDFPWLFTMDNGNLGCKWCFNTQTNLNSPFGNSKGSDNFQRSALSGHDQSRPHSSAAAQYGKSNVKVSNKKSLQNFFSNRSKVSSTTTGLLLNNAYFSCWTLNSLKFAENLNGHMKKCGVDLGDHYLNDTAMREMVLSLATAVQLILKKAIVSSNSLIFTT